MELKARVLIVEDDLDYQEYYKNWLSDESFLVKMSNTFREAERILEAHYFDVVIVDMNLEGDKQGGMKVLQEIERIGDSTRAIVISADATREDVRDSEEKFGATVLFKRELDKERLIRAVDQAVKKVVAHGYGEKSLYRFLLKEKGLSDEQIFLISKYENDLKILLQNTFREFWPLNVNLPITSKLVEVLGSKYMIQISGWSRGTRSAVVVRLGSRGIIEKESHAYNKHIRDSVGTSKLRKEGPFYYKDLGALVYVLSDAQFGPIHDFADFYESENDPRVVQAVADVFRLAEKLYKNRGLDEVTIDLSLVYRSVIEQAAAYQKRTTKEEEYYLNQLDEDDRASILEERDRQIQTKVNPIEFLLEHDFIFEDVPVGVVHGDLHGGNIMVGSEAKELQTWLLGFYNTGESDVIVAESDNSDSVAFRARQVGKRNFLHDYATMEISIRRTLSNVNLREIEEFDQALSEPKSLNEAASFQANFANPQLNKAYHVIIELRKRASNLIEFGDNMRLYYTELLFQFMAVYLRLPDGAEKECVYHSATVLAGKLDNWRFPQ